MGPSRSSSTVFLSCLSNPLSVRYEHINYINFASEFIHENYVRYDCAVCYISWCLDDGIVLDWGPVIFHVGLRFLIPETSSYSLMELILSWNIAARWFYMQSSRFMFPGYIMSIKFIPDISSKESLYTLCCTVPCITPLPVTHQYACAYVF